MKNNIQPPLFIVGETVDNAILQKLERLGFKPLLLPSDERLPYPTRAHADMLLFLIEKTVFCNEEYYKKHSSIFLTIKKYGYTVVPCKFEVKNEYPYDISLNQARLGRFIMGNQKYCAREILNFANANDYAYIPINQGYAKCSTLILNDNAIITADDSIVDAAKKLEIDVLKIHNGTNNISLEPYDYGFIGGATAVYNNTIFFFGNVALHENSKDILLFCQKHGFSTNSLSKEKLADIGGAFILPFAEH